MSIFPNQEAFQNPATIDDQASVKKTKEIVETENTGLGYLQQKNAPKKQPTYHTTKTDQPLA